MRLTAEQIETIQACGSKVLPVVGEAFHILSQQNRIFDSGGAAVVVRRPSGFLETRGTLALLLTQHADALRAFSTLAELPPPGDAGTRRVANGEATGEPPTEPARRQPEPPAAVPPSRDPEGVAVAVEPAGHAAAPSAAVADTRADRAAPPVPDSRAADDVPAEEQPDGGVEADEPSPDQAPAAQPSIGAATRPAVPIEDSIQPDHLVCLEDGRKMKMLTRHLRTAYAMSPEQYRARWSLPPDYPMVAPDTAERRVLIAKQPRPGAKTRPEMKQGAGT